MAPFSKSAGTPSLGLQMILATGIVFLALFNGGLITMGITCISLLSPNKCNSTTRRLFWRAYIVVLLVLNIGFLTATFILSYRWIIYHSRPTKGEHTSKALSFFADLTALVILCLTDGFLVWRCYMVQVILSAGRSKIQTAMRVLPLFLLITMAALGLIAELIRQLTTLDNLVEILEMVPLIINIFLNISIPSFLITRLLLHKRMVAAHLGSDICVTQHLRTVSILLESAVLNLPVTIVGAVGMASKRNFGWITAGVGIASQSFASVLILHQVALGRAISHQSNYIETHRVSSMPTIESPYNVVLHVDKPEHPI